MNVLEKVRYLREKKRTQGYGGPYRLNISTEENKWYPGEIEELKKKYKGC